MSPRKKLNGLGALFLLSLALPAACTDNPPSRVIRPVTAAAGTGGKTPNATGGSSGGGAGGSAGSAGSGGAGPDACLPPCDDPAGCMLTPEQQLMVDFCRLYEKRCPDQPADVMVDQGIGEQIPAGPAAPSTPTRPQLSESVADDLYSIEKALAGGGVYTVAYSGTGVGSGAAGESGAGGQSGATGTGGEGGAGDPLGVRTVSYAEGAWDPRGPIEDVNKIVPGIVVDPNGDPMTDGTYETIQSAISAAVVVAGCPRVFIKVLPGTYREKITVPAKTSSPPVTIYGVDRDPSKITIVAGHSAAGAEDDGTPLTIHQSATFTNSLPQPFQARNLTIQNDYVAGTYLPDDPDAQTAVALLSQADKALFDNVRILGHRNAIYVKSTGANEVSRVYFRNSYIEGDEDMILGRGAAVFDQCRIHSLGDRVRGGAISAASTRVDNPHGILIINSELTADARVSGVSLGHHWFEGDEELAVGKTIVRNSILGAHIRQGNPWAATERVTPKDPSPREPRVLYTSDDFYEPGAGLVPPEVYVAEFGNSGPGAAE